MRYSSMGGGVVHLQAQGLGHHGRVFSGAGGGQIRDVGIRREADLFDLSGRALAIAPGL